MLLTTRKAIEIRIVVVVVTVYGVGIHQRVFTKSLESKVMFISTPNKNLSFRLIRVDV